MNAVPSCIVVDDDVTQMHALCDALNRRGFATQGCVSAQAALDAVRPGVTELILASMRMPEFDAIAICNAARKIDSHLALLVMIEEATVDVPRAMQCGTFDFIIKPFQPDLLVASVQRALETRRLRRELTRLRHKGSGGNQQSAITGPESELVLHAISHDLRAPLRTISGFAQILEEDFSHALGFQGMKTLAVIRADAAKMDELILGLLDFSRAGISALEPDRLEMTPIARMAADELCRQHAAHPDSIAIAPLPAANADRLAMRQVWLNLIGNALKYSAKCTQRRIDISGRYQGNEAIYQIEDNGVGFDSRYLDKLFGIFERLHNGNEFPGRGVGLAVAKRLIVRQGGRIWASGAPNQGACFEFALPRTCPVTVSIDRAVQS